MFHLINKCNPLVLPLPLYFFVSLQQERERQSIFYHGTNLELVAIGHPQSVNHEVADTRQPRGFFNGIPLPSRPLWTIAGICPVKHNSDPVLVSD